MSPEIIEFDVTDIVNRLYDGKINTNEMLLLQSFGLLAGVAGAMVPGFSYPRVGWLTKFRAWLSLSGKKKVSRTPIPLQATLAKQIIKAGKDNGVKRLKIRIDKDAGLSLGGEFQGASLSTKIGQQGLIDLEVEYK